MSPRIAAHKAPFPYFGSKAAIASEVWARLGDVGRYIEPFAGSFAVLLVRPKPFTGREIANDSDGLLVNTWRAMTADPEAVAKWADWPATENDLHARHAWLVGQREDITRRLEGDPDWFDPKAAGWWLWGISLCIGRGWCSGEGAWKVSDDGQLLHAGSDGQGIRRQLLHASSDGQGIHAASRRDTLAAVFAELASRRDTLAAVFAELAARLRDTLIMCGDWSRVVTPAVLHSGGSSKPTAVFLDPPYADTAGRDKGIYAHDSESVAHAVREWAIANGDDPRLRIALCGYEDEHVMPDTWTKLAWKAHGGFGNQSNGVGRANARRERIWFSPHRLRQGLWDDGHHATSGA